MTYSLKDIEMDSSTLERRQRDITYGKNSQDYLTYREFVEKDSRWAKLIFNPPYYLIWNLHYQKILKPLIPEDIETLPYQKILRPLIPEDIETLDTRRYWDPSYQKILRPFLPQDIETLLKQILRPFLPGDIEPLLKQILRPFLPGDTETFLTQGFRNAAYTGQIPEV